MPITKLNRRRSIVVLLCAILLFGTVFSTTVFADTGLNDGLCGHGAHQLRAHDLVF